jgi:hypothetical protein
LVHRLGKEQIQQAKLSHTDLVASQARADRWLGWLGWLDRLRTVWRFLIWLLKQSGDTFLVLSFGAE